VYDDLITLWDRLVEEHVFFDCGASRNAYKQEGKKTLAYEIAEQTGFRLPDVVVAPVAVGETFIATARGFRELAQAGLIPRAPRLVAAQAARANAITRAFRAGTPIAPLKIGYTVAEGLAAGNPGRKGDWVLRLLREGDGLAADAEDDEILEAQRLLARVEGVWAGPTGVATLAVLQRLLARVEGVWAGPTGVATLAVLRRLLAEKQLDPGATVCAIISETGLKTEAPLPSRAGTAFDADSLRRLVHERTAAAG
jgi:threonine synthase